MTYAEFGGSRPGSHTAGLASSQVIGFNSHRKKLIIQNDAANTIYFTKGDGPAIANTGIFLLPGGSWILEPDRQGYIWKGAIQCIGLVAAQNLTWQEDW
ncbi:unnamed protein product [marine sediment metagenome]|uniref:Uncharacterized protein n=1 Tax=marine sediment metagenome TaxID=412755 RepID=X1TJJ4_9ZZZZ